MKFLSLSRSLSPASRSDNRLLAPPSRTGSGGKRPLAPAAASIAAAVIQTSTSSGENRASNSPTVTLAMMKATDPMPRGQP